MSQLIGQPAPDFTAAAVMPEGQIEYLNFAEWRADRYALVFFYPLDFTFVCPTELIALHHRMQAFADKDVAVCAVSVDSAYTHNAWRNTATRQGGTGAVDYPLIADNNHHICRAYGVELEDVGVALRASFILDRAGLIRYQGVNDLPLGRNIDELLRLVDALQFHEEHGEVCPAGWYQGQTGMRDTPDGVAEYLAQSADNL